MRFKLYLKPIYEKQRLPFNYQYPLQAWIYGLLHNADAQYAHFLHQRGYSPPDSYKSFKHFTFSNLDIPHFDKVKPGDTYIGLHSDAVMLTVSFYVDKAAEDFMVGIFQNQQLSIYNRDHRADFVVERIECLPLPILGNSPIFRTLSPLVVAEKVNGLDQYLSPTDEAFGRFFALNLVDKYRSLQTKHTLQLDAEAAQKLVKFELLSDPKHIKKRGILIKEGKSKYQTKVIGYHNFSFRLAAPSELLEVGYWGGFGKYTTMGCGCVEVEE
ncbi:MAG: CRISPR-associated endoribonuclease Cas6 [Runella sp.]